MSVTTKPKLLPWSPQITTPIPLEALYSLMKENLARKVLGARGDSATQDGSYIISTILSHLTKECHMKYSFAELRIISNIHTSVEDECNINVDDYSMAG